MARSKQAIRVPSSAVIHEALTMPIISGIDEAVHRRKREKHLSTHDL